MEHGPSERAAEAAREVLLDKDEERLRMDPCHWQRLLGDAAGPLGGLAREALNAAHDPALGLDRSVRLRDVVETIRAGAGEHDDKAAQVIHAVADFVEREYSPTGGRGQ